jgi:hypothetical protein
VSRPGAEAASRLRKYSDTGFCVDPTSSGRSSVVFTLSKVMKWFEMLFTPPNAPSTIDLFELPFAPPPP